MTKRLEISDEEWAAIQPILATHGRVRVGDPVVCRAFSIAVWWVLRSGGPGSDCCRNRWETGIPYSNVFRVGVSRGALKRSTKAAFICRICRRFLLTRRSFARIRVRAAAADGCAKDEALGRSRGGFSTKVHAVTDALGNPLDFVLTGGQESDIGQAETWLALTPEGAEALAGDEGYDSDKFIAAIETRGMAAVIPPRSNRTQARECDWFVYQERHLIECFFNKIKHYRRIFSRFEKLGRNYRQDSCASFPHSSGCGKLRYVNRT
ncbi:MAG: IS5 family transposase [Methylococcales bacterium]